MRIRTGHGPNDWTPNTPGANPGSSKIGGHLVIGAPGPNDKDRAAETMRRWKAKKREKAA